jgi:LPS-assembly lipoprotein
VTAVRRISAGLVMLLAALLAGACGFRLQGAMTLPEGVASVYVSAPDLLTPFAVELQRGLERSGAATAASAAEADAVIRVRSERTGRRVLSVSARNTPQEFEIFYTVDYTIERDGTEVAPLQRHELTRSFSFAQSALIAKDREEDVLREAMARDLAALVLRRLDSLQGPQSDRSQPRARE